MRKAIRSGRLKLGVLQDEFANICGLDRTYIGGIKPGDGNVSLVSLERVARALEISLPELLREV